VQGKSLYLELDEENVMLIDPQDLSVLNVQPIQSIRVWGVGRNNGRYRTFLANPWLYSVEVTLTFLAPFFHIFTILSAGPAEHSVPEPLYDPWPEPKTMV